MTCDCAYQQCQWSVGGDGASSGSIDGHGAKIVRLVLRVVLCVASDAGESAIWGEGGGGVHGAWPRQCGWCRVVLRREGGL